MKRKVEKEYVLALPVSISLGYQNIKLVKSDLIDGAQGVYLADSSEIRIKEGLDDREILNTLIHEVLHACVYLYGLRDEFKDDDHEEKVVNALGNALTEVMIRNKPLAAWVHQNVQSL